MEKNQPIIAVLDSGVDYEHPALKNRIWLNSPADINLSSCENDLRGCNTTQARRGRLGNGDVFPFGTTGPGQPCRSDDSNCAHGTHVAGLIAGNSLAEATGFGGSVAGVCPVCRIMILKIVGQVGKESGILDSSIISAFKYVALFQRKGSSGVRIINASFGKFARSRAVGLLIRLMRDRRQALVISAAGNEDTMTMEYPAAFSDAIAVAAVDQKLRKESFSNFGRWVDIAAPGAMLSSSIPGGGIGAKSGTSMAAPLVSGVAGLMLARYPEISYSDLKKNLLQSSDPNFYRSDWEGGFNYQNYYPKIAGESFRIPLLGLGLLNAEASLKKVTTDSLPIYAALDRVTGGCSVIGGALEMKKSIRILVMIFVPLIITLVDRKVKKNTPIEPL